MLEMSHYIVKGHTYNMLVVSPKKTKFQRAMESTNVIDKEKTMGVILNLNLQPKLSSTSL